RRAEPRLASALAPHRSRILDRGSLALAFTGTPQLDSRDCLCLLDGHIDNAAALRVELGLSPSGALEQLLAAGWRRWREELVARLRGDFALVVWDAHEQEGLIARDQLGVR